MRFINAMSKIFISKKEIWKFWKRNIHIKDSYLFAYDFSLNIRIYMYTYIHIYIKLITYSINNIVQENPKLIFKNQK